MSRFQVAPGALHQLGEEVRGAVDVARTVHKKHDELAGHAAHAGHSDVARAIADFLHDWAYGCGHLVSDAEHLADLLRHAGALYVDIDEQVGELPDAAPH